MVAEDLPFRNEQFDCVLFLDVLEHVRSERRAIAEVKRVLRVGGHLLLSVPYRGPLRFLDPHNLPYTLLARVWRFVRGSRRPRELPPFHRHYSVQQLRDLLNPECQIIQCRRFGLVATPVRFFLKYLFVGWQKPDPWWMRRILGPLVHIESRLGFGPLGDSVIIKARKVG